MSVTIADLLACAELGDVEILAGAGGLNRPIKWVTILEVLDELTLLEQGDLLVSTGYGLLEDHSLQKKLILLLVEKQLAGLAIQPGFYLEQLPEIILSHANQYDFPIIKLSPNLAFNKLTKIMLRQIISHQNHLLHYSENIYKKFTKILLTNQGLQQIAEILVKLINRPVKFIDTFYEAICSSGDSLWPSLKNLHRAELTFNSNNIEYLDCQDMSLWVTPISTGAEILGYICVLDVNTQQPLQDLVS